MIIQAAGRGGVNETHVPTEQPAPEAHPRLSRSHGERGRAGSAQAQARQGAQTPDRQHPAEAGALSDRLRGRQKLPRRWRVRNRREYVSLQQQGRRRSTPHFVVVSRPRPEGVTRLGITVSRRVGGAVMRNRVKRRVREWFRRRRHLISPPQDVIIIARPGAAELSYAELTAELTKPLRV
jgi:ribonuclease P protein component